MVFNKPSRAFRNYIYKGTSIVGEIEAELDERDHIICRNNLQNIHCNQPTTRGSGSEGVLKYAPKECL